MIATDMLYFAVARDRLDGGVQITASHNPKQYNGMKMVRQEAFPLSGDAGHRRHPRHDRAGSSAPAGGGTRRRDGRNVLDAYVEHVMSFIDPSVIRPFNVVLDAGSGMGGLVAPRLFDRLPCKTTRLCFEIDGRFPNHEANPLIEENRRDIVERVVAEKADIGIAWDGDADRCFFIDGTGEFIAGDFITALLAEAFLLKHPGATIIYDLRASYAVKDIVARYGGTALMNRVGHAFFKSRMRETNAIFGGEVTGHYYFRDNFYADNGFIPALLILELMSKKGQSLPPAAAAAARGKKAHFRELDYEDAETQQVSETVAFTLVDFAACDPRCAKYFAKVPRAKWTADLVPVSEFLTRERKDLTEKVPCLLMVDRDNRLQKVIVNDNLVREARRCVDAWRSLQELGGIHNSHAARLVEQERKIWVEKAQAAAAVVSQQTSAAVAAPTAAPAAPAPAVAAPAAAEVAPERSPDEAYIETARCTTCNECTQINDKMFGYDANKQASIINPDAGTYRQLVEAAENCQISIIHPGKPRNPNEPGLDELMKRAELFL